MTLLESLHGRLSLPVIGSPLFIISVPDLVVAQCCAGIVGSMLSSDRKKAWKGIWEAGQGVGAVKPIEPAAAVIARLRQEYEQATASLRSARAGLRGQ